MIDDTIVLYTADYLKSAYTHKVLSTLAESTVCEVTEERNGIYELYIEYPVAGLASALLSPGLVVEAKDSEGYMQPFRIYKTEKGITGIVCVWAEHISYQLNSIPVKPFTAANVSAALSGLLTNSIGVNPFTFWTNKTSVAEFSPQTPAPLRSLLVGHEGSILDTYGGGDYRFHRYEVRLYADRGADRGFTIRYGKNLTGLSAEQDVSGLFNGVCPYWAGEDGSTVTIPEGAVWSSDASLFPYRRTKVVDFTADFETPPTVAQLRARATTYLNANGATAIPRSITVDMLPLVNEQRTPELTGVPPVIVLDGSGNIVSATPVRGYDEVVRLCDTVTVEHEGLGISVKAKIIKTVWDCLTGRYKELTIGTARTTLEDTLVGMEDVLTDAQTQLAQKYLNVNGGTLYGSLTVNGTVTGSNIPIIQQGNTGAISGVSSTKTAVAVTFDTAFPGAPKVFLTPIQNGGYMPTVKLETVSSSGFRLAITIPSGSTNSISVDWMAIYV